MITSPWAAMGLAWAGGAALLAILWEHQRRTRNATLVDVGWTLTLGGCAAWYASIGTGAGINRAIAGALGVVWCGRLAWHLLSDRVLGAKPEDARYATLRAHWNGESGTGGQWKWFVFYQTQALAAVMLSLPYLLLSCDSKEPTAVRWAGVGLWAVAMGNEALADRQLARFRDDPANRGRVCRAGWWRYSRHPNYFFEWLVWVGLAVSAGESPWGWASWSAPLAMLVLVTKVSGVPWVEKQSLRSRGEDYRRYQRETSVFVPWLPAVEQK